MTINKKGGKHKHKKRQRNNPHEGKNYRNIHNWDPRLGTYVAQVISKGLLVKINKSLSFFRSLRTSIIFGYIS